MKYKKNSVDVTSHWLWIFKHKAYCFSAGLYNLAHIHLWRQTLLCSSERGGAIVALIICG